MYFDVEKTGLGTTSLFVTTITVNFSCGLYCIFLLYVTWHYLWNWTKVSVQIAALDKTIQASAPSDGTETSVSVAVEKTQSTVDVDKKIKWIVTLYILGSCLICIFSSIERILYGSHLISGEACGRALYASYLRVFTDGVFFSFYLVRVTVLLRGTVFELSKYTRIFFGGAPVITFGSIVIAHNIRSQTDGCSTNDQVELILLAAIVACHLFWNIALFVFLFYYIHKVSKELIGGMSIQDSLKSYLKKLLQLFFVAEVSAAALAACILIPDWSSAVWSIFTVDLCVNCTTMLLCFPFSKHVFDRICLCKI